MSQGMKGLSSTVLDMKFMRRTKQRIEEKEKRKKDEELQAAYLKGDSASGEGTSVDKVVFTKDLEFLEDLSFGRLSFRGYNPQVEKLMKYYVDKKNGVLDGSDSEIEKDVNDEDMAETLGGLSRTIGGKFKAKVQRSHEDSRIDESTGDVREAKKRKHTGSATSSRGRKVQRT